MAATLSANINPRIATLYRTALDLVTTKEDIAVDTPIRLTDGTSANQIDLQWSDTSTIAISSSDTLDLAGGLTDGFGTTLTFVEIVMIYVRAASGNTNDVEVGAGSNPLLNWVLATGDGVVVKPGGIFLILAPTNPAYAVTGGTGDILEITNSSGGTEVTYDIVILGRSA